MVDEKKTKAEAKKKAEAKAKKEKEDWYDLSQAEYEKKYFEVYKKHEFELVKNQLIITPWPKPISSYHIEYDAPNVQIEPLYYWILTNVSSDLGFPIVDKITDLYATSEHSAFFGISAQKLGAQQDKAAQYLKFIHDMVKGLVLLVRDLSIIDEKLAYFKKAHQKDEEGESAEKALKGQFVDLVEGGAKNPMSVIGLAQEARFTTLPDLFFKYRCKPNDKGSFESVNSLIERTKKLISTETLTTLLQRKLESYYLWRERIEKELNNRRTFTLKYLRQQYDTILLYGSWVKPYLKQIKRLSQHLSKLDEAHLVAAFDASVLEVEFLARPAPKGNYSPVLLIHFEFITKPAMAFQQEGYNRGPSHSGELKIDWRSYAWTEEDIKRYKKLRDEETIGLLGEADLSLKSTMDSIGEDLKKYLIDAGEIFPGVKTKEEKKDTTGILDPFKGVIEGFKEFGKALGPPLRAKSEKNEKDKEDENSAKKTAKKMLWTNYKLFKKSQRMTTW